MSPHLENVARQQAVVAELGLFALQEMNLQAVMDEAVRRVAETLDVEYCKVLELQPGGSELLLKAGVGWKTGIVGHARVGTERDSQAGYTLLSDEPVIVDDLRTETRFSGPDLLTSHDVVSGISVIIKSTQAPYGVMGAHTTKKRAFTQADAHFLQAVANVLGEAIERRRTYDTLEDRVQARTVDLHKKNSLLQLVETIATAANEATSMEDALQTTVDAVCRHTGWPLGHVYRRSSDDPDLMVPTSIWSPNSDGRFETLRQVTAHTCFRVGDGDGLPGRVAVSGEPVWIRDVTADPNVLRFRLTDDLGVKGAFGFPVHLDGQVVAVLEFFSERREALDRDLLDVMATVGTQLGRVAEREQTLSKLRASEHRYRSLIESAVDGIVVTDCEGRITDWNDGARAIFGYEKEEVIGQSAEMLMPERYRAHHREGMKRFNHTGEAHVLGTTVEMAGLRKNGDEFPLELSLSYWEIEGEYCFAAIIRDVTEKKKTQEALRRSEAKFRALAEESPLGICLFQDGVFQYVNPRFAEIFEYAPEEIIGRLGPKDMIHPEAWPEVREKIHQRLSGKTRAASYPSRGKTRTGKTVYLQVYGTRIDYQGAPAIVGSVLDVTEKRQLEQKLLQIQEDERRRIGRELHDGIASELTGIALLSASLTHRLKSGKSITTEELEEITELIRQSGEQARRLSQGLNPVEVGNEDLPTALDQLATMTQKQAGLLCVTRVGNGTLSYLDKDAATHLYRIAQESVNNAVKHARASTIEIRLDANGHNVTLTVTDDGKGFSDVGGAYEGIGLHTMRYRANLIGAQLEITDRPEGGTCIRCTIPG